MSLLGLAVVVLHLAVLFNFGHAAQPLGKYNVDRTKISVSGVSSGAAMATQLHVAYSSVFSGVGLIAGNPYWCSQGEYSTAFGACMNYPERINVNELTSQTTKYASSGDIDPTNNMYNSQIFVLSGALDSVVNPGIGQKVVQYYLGFVRESNIKSVFSLQADHTVPTVDYGNACNRPIKPWLGKCDYFAAFEMLNHFYGGDLVRPSSGTGALPGQFYQFDQREFFHISTPGASSMDTIGYVYVPSGCVDGANTCKLHVALHGCNQGRENVDEEFVRNAGYNHVGELNNIIILYPQAVSSIAAPVNPMGCWDWWGYTINDFATKKANQPLAIWRMVEKIAY